MLHLERDKDAYGRDVDAKRRPKVVPSVDSESEDGALEEGVLGQ